MRMEPMLASYNDNSAIQATCQRIGNPMLARMAARVAEVRPRDAGAVRIVEYGCSGGRNSIDPMHSIVSTFLAGAPELQFECILEDLPANPWHQVMVEAPRLVRMSEGRARVLCAGTSFYQPVCADRSIDVAYSYVAAHFLDDASPMTSHVLPHEANATERRAWDASAARDWERFLELRSRELKPGARMLVSTMSRDGDGYSWREFSHIVWDSIRATKALSQREIERLCIPASLRSEAEIMAPFATGRPLSTVFHVDDLQLLRTEIAGERTLAIELLAPLLRRRVESVWGGVFVTQLIDLGRAADSAQMVMREVWDRFEQEMARDPARGWLDMRSFYLQLTRN
jgi:hypothetical protein